MADVFLLAILAGAGGATLARLLAHEDGPWFALHNTRKAIAEYCDSRNAKISEALRDDSPWTSLRNFAHCPYCQSAWYAPVLFALAAMKVLPVEWLGALAAVGVAWWLISKWPPPQ